MPVVPHAAVAAGCRVLPDPLYIGTSLLCSCNTLPSATSCRQGLSGVPQPRPHGLHADQRNDGEQAQQAHRAQRRQRPSCRLLVPVLASCWGVACLSSTTSLRTVCVLPSPALPGTLASPLPARHLQTCRPSSEPQVDFSLSCASLSIDEGRNSKVGPACVAAGCPALAASLPLN